jgi:putative HNHc nuclease
MMASRIASDTAPGTLLKPERQRRDPKYLAAIRRLPCLVCRAAPCDAAHVRIGSHTGMGQKPSDRRAVPLCHRHHRQQHSIGERSFWYEFICREPTLIIAGLNEAYPDIDAMRAFILRNT